MIGRARRRELSTFAEAYAFDAAWLCNGDTAAALDALARKAQDAAEWTLVYRRFWAAYFRARARCILANLNRNAGATR